LEQKCRRSWDRSHHMGKRLCVLHSRYVPVFGQSGAPFRSGWVSGIARVNKKYLFQAFRADPSNSSVLKGCFLAATAHCATSRP
jgi:hypothetical protein